MEEHHFRNFIMLGLRRASYRWMPRNAAKLKARLGRNLYVCNSCKLCFGNKEIHIDHIVPVIDPIKGFVDWNEYISRLFCDEDGFQILCKPCHKLKTKEENQHRHKVVKKRKRKRK